MSAHPPPIAKVQPMSPPALDYLVRACLAKDPDDRIQTAHDVKLQLRWISETGSQFGAPQVTAAKRTARERTWLGLAVVTTLAALVLLALHVARPKDATTRPVIASVLPPAGLEFAYDHGPPALSPDGSRIALVCRTDENLVRLWLRDLDKPALREVDGTDGASFPFWSPDSHSIGFFADGKLKRVDAGGDPPDTLCDAPNGLGGTWNEQGRILFAPDYSSDLSTVSASGGVPVKATTVDAAAGEVAHRFPCFLPDGRHFLYSARNVASGAHGLCVGALDGAPPRRLLKANSNVIYVKPGYLLFWRGGSLRAQAFDTRVMALAGDPFIVGPQARLQPKAGVAQFTASQNGILAYHREKGATQKSRLLLRDRAGVKVGTVGPEGNFYSPRISHDGSRVVVDNSDVGNNGDIWIYSLSTPAATRLTPDAVNESRPIWSPDDLHVAYSSYGETRTISTRRIDRADQEEVLLTRKGRDDMDLMDWSPDGEYIIFVLDKVVDIGKSGDIWLYSVDDAQALPFIDSPYHEHNCQFSPGGQWIAYTSDESGQTEVYVQSFPELTHRRQVSFGGGTGPRWSDESNELFYTTPGGVIMAAGFDHVTGDIEMSATPLFDARPRFREYGLDYDVTPDGQTFLINTAIEDQADTALSLVINWPAMIKSKR
jgi:Tol biopolymer transport system component